MNKRHRKILSDLALYCNHLGDSLDYTATHESKLRDRQQALMKVHHVLYGVLVDVSENECREEDMEKAEKCLNELLALTEKLYPDRNGNRNPRQLAG